VRLSYPGKITVALGVLLALFLALVVSGLRSVDRLRDNLALVEHTRASQTLLQDLRGGLFELESATRAADAARFQRAADEFDRHHAALGQLDARHPERAATHRQLHDLLASLRQTWGAALGAPGADGAAAIQAALDARTTRASLAEARAILVRLQAEEADTLVDKQRAGTESIERTLQATGLLAAFAALALGALAIVVRREAMQRDRAARAEAQSVAALEHRVDERTTELKQALDALELNRARLEGIIGAATDAIVTADATQTIVMANGAAAALLGAEVSQIVGSPLDRFVPLAARVRHRDDVERFGVTGRSARAMGHGGEITALRADGEEIPVDVSISHLNVHGQPLYTAILRDCRDRRRAQAALRESEARLRRLLALLPEAVLVDTGERITYANEAACRLFGAPADWFDTHRPDELLHPESRVAVQARRDALRSGAEAQPLAEERILRADGSARTVETTVTPIDEHGTRAVLVVMRDVSELRRAQRELARSRDELRRLVANQERVRESERVRIARELHDDLQQTLAAIRLDVVGAAAQLQQRPAAVAQTLAAIDELVGDAIVSTRRIVNDLRPQLLDELGLVAALRSLAAQFSQRTGLRVHVSVAGLDEDQALPPTVSICLYRVAQEALNNVAKHAQATTVELQLQRQGRKRLVLRVHDDGQGMSPALADKPQSFGLLGMRERVRALAGELRIDSSPRAGTTIEALLPWTPDAVTAGASTPP